MIGQTLAHYKILEKIGSGGMGDVYLAADSKLDRKVALKVLPPDLAENEERRTRFQREAKAIAALDHPNIVQVFSVEEAKGTHFITMQLVQGKTLTELLPKKGFPLSKFFDIAIPLADAVAAAHEQGIVHRDLKPGNVMVTDDDRTKVLDFGLAQRDAPVRVDGDSESPTAVKTQEGVLAGTLHYMSPEQAEGKPLDARSDIFSLGVMFYEMLIGCRPFGGDTPAAALSSILKDTPVSMREARPELPRELAKIVNRCLSKPTSRRFQSALDVRNELDELRVELSAGELEAASVVAKQPALVKWLAAATMISIVTSAGVLFYFLGPSSDAVPEFRSPIQITSAAGVEDFPTWSPDGGRIAFHSQQSGNWDIWVAQLAGETPVNLTAGRDQDDRYPSWSPDGSQIAFVSDVQVFVMPALGGRARGVLSLEEGFVTGPARWSADGSTLTVMFAESGGYSAETIIVESFETRRLELSLPHRCIEMSLSPEGDFLACVDAVSRGWDVSRIWIYPVSGSEPVYVTDGTTRDFNPSWGHDGRSLFFVSNRGGTMDVWRQHLDGRGRPQGEPEPLTVGVGLRTASWSPDGRKLAYSRGRRIGNLWRVPILSERSASWEDAQQITFDHAYIEYPDLSPDGKTLVLNSDRSGNQDLWKIPAGGGEMTQLTRERTPDWGPRWSPDGSEIAFYSFRTGNRDVWVMPSEGGAARPLAPHPATDYHLDWSPDGNEIVFASDRAGQLDLWVVSALGGEPRNVVDMSALDNHPVWMPQGNGWLLQPANEEPLRIWHATETGREPVPFTDGSSYMGAWSPDGRHLYFTAFGDRTGRLWSRSVATGAETMVADLRGRRGGIQVESITTDGEYVYFVWVEDLGDIWVMDVVTDED